MTKIAKEETQPTQIKYKRENANMKEKYISQFELQVAT